MKIKFSKISGSDLKEILDSLPQRVKNVATEVGRAVSRQTAAEVQKRLKSRGGWVKIYHDAIIYHESDEGSHWAIAGYTEIHPELFQDSAENTLLTIKSVGDGTGEQNPTMVLSNYQPWPIDMIPALANNAAYPGIAEVKMYDPGTVETWRAARLANLPTVLAALGAQVDTTGDSLVSFQRVFADIAFMARRLELGYQGYPRIPHWGPAASALGSRGESWASTPAVLRLVESALKGGDPVEVAKMSPARAAEFARIREASWS